MIQSRKTYKIEGLSCANCAGKFERNVQRLASVEAAQVNFGASKIYVTGNPSVEELEGAGAFENLKLTLDERQRDVSKTEQSNTTQPATWLDKAKQFYSAHQAVCVATLLMALGYTSHFMSGENHVMTMLLFACSIVLSGSGLLIRGVKNLVHLEFDMHTLMTIAVIGGALIGQWGEVAAVVILFAISEALETFSMDKARQSMQSLMDIAPDEATVIRAGQHVKVPVDDIAIDEILYIKPGQKIALDGVVVAGRAAVNEAAITGESMPVEKVEDAEVYAGTLNEDGVLEVRVTKTAAHTTLAKMIQLVEEAQVNQAPAQAFIEKFARYYTPAIMIIALLVALVPPFILGQSFLTWVYQGLAVLVVGCPCALVIATPISIVSSIGNAAKNGVLIKGGIHLEQMSRIRAVAFDKTGTLTMGQPEVTTVQTLTNAGVDSDLIGQIAAIESRSDHPLARAIVRYAQTQQHHFEHYEVTDFHSQTGQGVTANIEGRQFIIGQPQMFQLTQPAISTQIQQLQEQGHTVILVSVDGTLCMLIAMRDAVREQSQKAIKALRELGIQHTVMLTGDNSKTAHAIAQKLNITDVKADLMPVDKLNQMEQLKQQYGTVAMVGDGVNDAPALASASVGIAMGGASTDTALETADIALLSDDMSKLPFTYRLSQKTMRIIKANITFAILIKLVALLLVIPGWLTLWIAVFSDMGATLIVALNAIRLLYVKASDTEGMSRE
ncbi:heavy metal translocating P-type ATPase [Staphylococcus intermedius]|uniref:Cd(2+)-exporting ATPase n=1 Tax=Staphylococcus intermedius NCTC 11048 TaxID=1141106 RepID=A0A380G8N6_STAIN|nr:heavy metal translocating P-type ATPase [Staphylococcus intermedius]PCF65033.1 copper-translocating P-type ATPase [Staphylococcus intermedius]PCF80644.1 copper-translocating P-type ATPase [Staphylococcus intermedius]PCF81993.1 copper-translocating P-type ATPase [Staphylococcus intermedius]PCF88329.1 copper-translocating P-type ATPase [Staphylococcus intermedius]PCF89044.1 copper-translocating P-type ATPase [Staphylococcus intermedius]